ncbi:copper amine oxidase N-terminal domain-containing protein [Paenibacillus paridis]|uniref:copper amine oxidase N-terminal domain-containing protein n=1 Tax=Paenibacillus paridis TaxID=2583376 RepID=UPI001EE41F8F|nr:copper amine oxidase N-terminal domain-containing protein [Paenibacillus paridis]
MKEIGLIFRSKLSQMDKMEEIGLKNRSNLAQRLQMNWIWLGFREIDLICRSKLVQKAEMEEIGLKNRSILVKGSICDEKNSPVNTGLHLSAAYRGAQVNYENDKIIVAYADQRLEMQVYDANVTLNGKKHKMNAAMTSYRGKTYVPVRFISEALGAKVQWDAWDGCVIVKL